MTKPNGKSASLDTRIAAALGNDKLGLPELRALLKEADETRASAKQDVEVQFKAMVDPTIDDAEASQRRLQRSKLTVDRLNAAIPQLAARVKRLEQIEYRAIWNEQLDVLEKQRDALAEELREVYPSILDAITSLYADADANWTQIEKLQSASPPGEFRRLVDAECKARGLSSYTAAQPRLRDALRLPDWNESRVIAFPQFVDWNARAAMLNQSMAEQMRAKWATAGSADWAVAQEQLIAQQEAEHAKRDKELEAKRAAEKAKYEAALRAGK